MSYKVCVLVFVEAAQFLLILLKEKVSVSTRDEKYCISPHFINTVVQTFSRMQILHDFDSRCQALTAKDSRGFKQEFEALNDVGKDLPTRVGDSEPNRLKNRYPSIVPYDHCRVGLSIQSFQPYSDYINANFVPGGQSERDFICTQGPLPNTMADFWRMVWEQNVRIIVMVTPLKHKDIVLCEKYWPLDRGTVYHGLIQVTTVACKQGPDYFVTTIHLRQRDCPTDRIITHYYYPSWPDQGVPKDSSSLCAFTEHVRQHLKTIPDLGPSVVHCSAGVGRSGTFVALLWLMQLCSRGIWPEVRSAVEDLRLHRMWMVQTLEQYILVHRCLLHWLSGGTEGTHPQTQRVSSKMNHHIKDRQGDRSRRRRHHHHRAIPLPEPPQNTIQQILHPGNLLRRLLPSSSIFKPAVDAVRRLILRAENQADNKQSKGGKEPQTQQIAVLQAKQKSRKLPALQVEPVLL